MARSSPAAGDPDLFGYATVLHRVVESSDPQDFDHAIQNTWCIANVLCIARVCDYITSVLCTKQL